MRGKHKSALTYQQLCLDDRPNKPKKAKRLAVGNHICLQKLAFGIMMKYETVTSAWRAKRKQPPPATELGLLLLSYLASRAAETPFLDFRR